MKTLGTPKIPWYVSVASVGSVMLGAYHGFSRNKSVGSAALWGIGTGLFWPIMVPIIVYQRLHSTNKALAGKAEQITKYTPKRWRKRAKRAASKSMRRAGKRGHSPKRVTKGWAD